MEHSLTDVQLAVLRALWRRGEATVAGVQEHLRPERPLATTTVATLLSRLEKKGVVTNRTEGRQYGYPALVAEGDVRRSALASIVEGIFGGDVGAAVSSLLAERDVGPEDLARVKAMVEAKERELSEARDE